MVIFACKFYSDIVLLKYKSKSVKRCRDKLIIIFFFKLYLTYLNNNIYFINTISIIIVEENDKSLFKFSIIFFILWIVLKAVPLVGDDTTHTF